MLRYGNHLRWCKCGIMLWMYWEDIEHYAYCIKWEEKCGWRVSSTIWAQMWSFYYAHIKVRRLKNISIKVGRLKNISIKIGRLKNISRMGHGMLEKKRKEKWEHNHTSMHYVCFNYVSIMLKMWIWLMIGCN